MAVLAGLLDAGLAVRAWYSRKLAISRLSLLGLVAAAALGVGMLMGIGEADRAFREVFSRLAPHGVKELAGQRQYAGLYDRDDIVLRFVADESALRAVLAGEGFVREEQEVQAYKAGKRTWVEFCKNVLWNPTGKWGTWMPAKPMEAPVVYTLGAGSTTQPSVPETVVLWDAVTGQAYVHRIGGS